MVAMLPGHMLAMLRVLSMAMHTHGVPDIKIHQHANDQQRQDVEYKGIVEGEHRDLLQKGVE